MRSNILNASVVCLAVYVVNDSQRNIIPVIMSYIYIYRFDDYLSSILKTRHSKFNQYILFYCIKSSIKQIDIQL